MENVEHDRDGVGEIEGRKLPAGRDVDEEVASGELGAGEAVVLRAEEQRHPAVDPADRFGEPLGGDRTAEERRRPPGRQVGRADDQVGPGHPLLEAGRAHRPLEDRDPAHGPPASLGGDRGPRVDDHEPFGAEIPGQPGHRAHIPVLFGAHEDHIEARAHAASPSRNSRSIIHSGSNGRRSSYPWPVPKNRIGRSTVKTVLSAAPPFTSASSFVRMSPSIPRAL